jgi:SAM-dependent methyltransferase
MTAPLAGPAAGGHVAGRRRLSDEQLLFIQEATAAAAAISAADRLGVLAQLEGGTADPATIARECAISERGARALLAALSSLGVAEAAGHGSYRASHRAVAEIRAIVDQWDGLTEAIRDERRELTADVPAAAEAMYPKVVGWLGVWFASAAEKVAERLAAPGLRVLDAGAGAAPWSLALTARAEDVRVTAVDLPAVIEATRRAVAAARQEAAFEYLPGDLFRLELQPSRYDLVIAGNLCHLFDEEANRRLLGRLLDALRPGGRLAILDALPHERMDGPRPVMLYALGLLMRTSRGQVYPFSSYSGWLRDAGYETVDRSDLGAVPPISLITARRPAG